MFGIINLFLMRLNLISHTVRKFYDLESIAKERYFLDILIPKADVILIKKHKLRDRVLDNLGNQLMYGYASWSLEAAP